MTTTFQLVIDAADPPRLVAFWTQALGYVEEPPPAGFPTWDDYWRDVGVPEDELVGGADRLVDPEGRGPKIWFQQVPETKQVKNRLHLDLRASGGRGQPMAERRAAITAEAERLERLGARRLRVLQTDGLDHFGIVLADPEGNEFCVH